MTESCIGRSTVRIYVPSRRKDGGILSTEKCEEWKSKTQRALEISPFGGSTPTVVLGSFVHEDGRITRENITVLSSSCSFETLEDEVAKRRIFSFAEELCKAMGQESIFVAWGDQAYLVSEDFDLTDVPIIRFDDLSPEAQLRHLTMGWGGIDQPSKVLQVLSLDGWMLPPSEHSQETEASSPALRAVLPEQSGARRAWSWHGDLAGLKDSRKRWSREHDPKPGDLVFLTSRAEYLDVVMVTGSGLAGPRDLRLSHGQLNPVTRHLLFRILRRDFAGLEADLTQKPLDQRFFPRLRELRAAVENALLDAAPSAAPRKKRTPERKTKTPKKDSASQKAAYRTSVLVVGRMMFLRFLAQKGWLPKGVDGLVGAYAAHGEKFFEHYVIPLWFDVLNTPADKRSDEARARFEGYPYLNGGLFQPRPGEQALRLPGSLFDPSKPGSFLQLFRDFEFSLNEYAGSDDSLRVDPSFFGKALESFNSPDDKKAEGIHYTPKPIGWSMALEAIVARLERLTGIGRARLEGLLREERELSGVKASEVQKALEDLRIIDPAVGSGVLLWACLEVLLALDSACEGLIGGGDGYQRGSRKWGIRSRHFVCNCLYGVDLSEEAVELTRLRLWLAVALSEDEPQILPDLELNICRGDSLLSPAPAAAGERRQLQLSLDEKTRLGNELEKLMAAYGPAGEKNPLEQRELRERALSIRRELARLDADDPQEEPPLNWDTFFPHVFGNQVKRGFDVVIANPPYVRIQNIDKACLGAYRSSWSTLRAGNADLSYAFVELALQKLAAPDGGQVAYIQPNFRHHDSAEFLRKLLVGGDSRSSARLRLWVDFDDTQVFPTATNYVAMLFAERTVGLPPPPNFTYSNPEPKAWERIEQAEDVSWLRPRGRTHDHPAVTEWLTLPEDLRERVLAAREGAKWKLGDIATIEVGLQTSADKIFLFKDFRGINSELVEVMPEGSPKPWRLEQALVRRCVKGSADNGYRLLLPYDRNGALLSEDELQEKYPMVWRYLRHNKKKLEQRENGRFAGKGWYRFGRNQGFAACSLPKVLVPSLVTIEKPLAIPDPEGILAFTASGKGGGGAWAVTPRPEAKVTLDELAATLQAQSAWDHYRAFGSPQKGGWRGVDRNVLKDLPL